MNIVVCIKQVPASNNVKVDPVTGTLIRDGANTKMNPDDLHALEMGFRIKNETNGTLTVISMGPPSALEVLREAIYMGADKGVLLSDRKFGGADVLATAYTLAQGIKKIGTFDIIITGRQTIDGDTGQIGAELAEYLAIPHISYVNDLKILNNRLVCVCNLDYDIQTCYINTPCLISCDTDINTPRLPSFKRKQAYKDCTELLSIYSFADLQDKDESHYGQRGSATQVERIFEPEKRSDKVIYEEGDLADSVYQILKDNKFV